MLILFSSGAVEQRSMKAEMEMAMKLLEKDVHEKQDTIISLRDQLEDIKKINLEMYTKLQVCANPYPIHYSDFSLPDCQGFLSCEVNSLWQTLSHLSYYSLVMGKSFNLIL